MLVVLVIGFNDQHDDKVAVAVGIHGQVQVALGLCIVRELLSRLMEANTD